MIPTDEIVDFANAINAGFEPSRWRSWRFLLRVGDEQRPVHGRPNIPSEYSSYLLEKPVEAEISAIKESRTKDSELTTTVVLNVGATQGVKQGMTFHVFEPSDSYDTAWITDVGDSQSDAKIVQYKEEKAQPPSRGWKLSTHVGPD